MKKILSLLIFLFATVSVWGKDNAALAKSDSLFAKGVELYNRAKYKDAIPYFAESDKIDKAELDEASNRRDYSAMWLASCYYKLGDSVVAQKYYKNYNLEPIDRRLTQRTDSLSLLAYHYFLQGEFTDALKNAEKCLDLEKQLFGTNHLWPAYTQSIIAEIKVSLKDETGLEDYNRSLEIIKQYCGTRSTDYCTVIMKYFVGLISLNKFTEAKQFSSYFLEVYKNNLDFNISDYSYILQTIAMLHSFLKDYESAIEYERQLLQIIENTQGNINEEYIGCIDNLIVYQVSLSNYGEALKLETENLKFKEILFGRDNPHYTKALGNIANFNFILGDYSEAIKVGEELKGIIQDLVGIDSEAYAFAIDNLAYYHLKNGDPKKGLALANEASEIMLSVYGPKNETLANVYDHMALCYEALGDYEKAISLEQIVVNIKNEVLGNENEGYLKSLSSLANYNFLNGKFNDALNIELSVNNAYEKIKGKENVNYVKSLSLIAKYQYSMGEYLDAISNENMALDLWEKMVGKNDYNYIESLNSLFNYYYELGDYKNVVKLVPNAIEYASNVLPEEEYLSMLEMISNVFSHFGDNTNAVQLGTKVLDLREETNGRESSAYARCLSSLAVYYANLGNYEKAIGLGTEALNIRKRILGPLHPAYATSLNNLALCYSNTGDLNSAIELTTMAMWIYQTSSMKEGYATTLLNLASYYSYKNNLTEAIELGNKAVDEMLELYGDKSPNYATALQNLASYYSESGEEKRAIELSRKALTIYKNFFGSDHLDYITALGNLAGYYYLSKDFTKVVEISREVNSLKQAFIRTQFVKQTENERNLFWNKIKFWFEEKIHFFAYQLPQMQELVEEAYNAILISKGILLANNIEFTKLLKENGDEEVLSKYEELSSLIKMINKQNEITINERARDINLWIKRAEELERELIEKSNAYGDFTQNMNISWQDVLHKLKPLDVAIEFVSFPDENEETLYSAYVIKPGMEKPVMVKLFSSKDFSKINSSNFYKTKEFSTLIWRKLDQLLNGVENIYFAPAGELYNIAIEHLPHYKEEGIMSDYYNIYRLSSTRMLVINEKEKSFGKTALFGGMQYETDSTFLEKDMARYPELLSRGDFSNHNLEDIKDNTNLRYGASALPGTVIEIDNINSSFTKKQLTAMVYKGLDGTEACFKSLSGKKVNIIHIATHGFYWANSQVLKGKNFQFLINNSDNLTICEEDKSLSRSGLLFSGANHVLRGNIIPKEVEDGVLTAKEIAHLDLRDLDLIVLSACQTGLGEIKGDGVFGLQRGFKKAGASTVLMSLWNVDDKATQMLMSKFYEEFLNNKSKYLALREAQKFVREYEEEIEYYEDITDDENLTKNPTTSLVEKSSPNINNNVSNKLSKTVIQPYKDPKYWAAFILLDALN